MTTVEHLVSIAERGIGAMRRTGLEFARTARCPEERPDELCLEDTSVRYAAIAALGLAGLPRDRQYDVLGGREAERVAENALSMAEAASDPGALAVSAWAAAELGLPLPDHVRERLVKIVDDPAPVETVVLAWALTALVAAGRPDAAPLTAVRAARRLLAATGPHGIFPHVVPARSLGRWRAHVACFADQVYPIQALARYFAVSGDRTALAAADRCAEQICALQGEAGPWWWHYDTRTGGVVERYPVYSVHQHAMAPMALLDLYEAGGLDARPAVAAGLSWVGTRPETDEPLVSDDLSVVWREVGRREPRKAVRAIRAAASALRPGIRLRALDVLCPPRRVDRECRPYELGWLLYAWRTPTVLDGRTRPRYGRLTDA